MSESIIKKETLSPETAHDPDSDNENRDFLRERDSAFSELLRFYENEIGSVAYCYSEELDRMVLEDDIEASAYASYVAGIDQDVTLIAHNLTLRVEQYLDEYSQICVENLTDEDQRTLARVFEIARAQNTTANSDIKRIMNTVSSPEAHKAMEAALDGFRFAIAKQRAMDLGDTSSTGVLKIMNTVSSPEAHKAMEAALDGFRFAIAKQRAMDLGDTSSTGVLKIMNTVSSPEAHKAMEAALDGFRFAIAKQRAMDLGDTSSTGVLKIMNTVSSPEARKIVNILVENSLISKSQNLSEQLAPQDSAPSLPVLAESETTKPMLILDTKKPLEDVKLPSGAENTNLQMPNVLSATDTFHNPQLPPKKQWFHRNRTSGRKARHIHTPFLPPLDGPNDI